MGLYWLHFLVGFGVLKGGVQTRHHIWCRVAASVHRVARALRALRALNPTAPKTKASGAPHLHLGDVRCRARPDLAGRILFGLSFRARFHTCRALGLRCSIQGLILKDRELRV